MINILFSYVIISGTTFDETIKDVINLFNETVINPPAELGRLTDARSGERSAEIKTSVV